MLFLNTLLQLAEAFKQFLPIGSCWDRLGNLFKERNLTDTFHWPVAPLSLENGLEA